MSAQDIINTKLAMTKKAMNRDIDSLADELVKDGISITANLIIDTFRQTDKEQTFTGDEVANIVARAVNEMVNGKKQAPEPTPTPAPAEVDEQDPNA